MVHRSNVLLRRHMKPILRHAIRFDAPGHIATARVTRHFARQKPQVLRELRPTRITEQERQEHRVYITVLTKRRLHI